jgi:hypothetical protein
MVTMTKVYENTQKIADNSALATVYVPSSLVSAYQNDTTTWSASANGLGRALTFTAIQ